MLSVTSRVASHHVVLKSTPIVVLGSPHLVLKAISVAAWTDACFIFVA